MLPFCFKRLLILSYSFKHAKGYTIATAQKCCGYFDSAQASQLSSQNIISQI